MSGIVDITAYIVSTHSRPKAAVEIKRLASAEAEISFQHTAARRRLILKPVLRLTEYQVSTHSRPKAAEPLLKALFHQVSQPRFR